MYYVNIYTIATCAFATVAMAFFNCSKGQNCFSRRPKADILTRAVVPGTQTMYNLEVAQDHTFAVGDGQWVVHNCNVSSLIKESNALVKEAEAAGKNQQVQREIDHLIQEFVGGNENPGIGSKKHF